MFTKSVTVCALGGVLIGTTLPGNPLMRNAEAQKAPVKTDEQSFSTSESAATRTSAPRSSQKAVHPQTQQRLHSDRGTTRKGDTVRHKQAPKDVGDRLGTFSVTAYTHYRNPRGGLNETAAGTLPKAGRTVAVDPRVIPLGSRIYITGVGERIAEDTGGKIKGKKLDLFLSSVQDCLQFGVRQYEVHLLAKE
jgi:3D (Asp-Asp-Asp) domain-containing protein